MRLVDATAARALGEARGSHRRVQRIAQKDGVPRGGGHRAAAAAGGDDAFKRALRESLTQSVLTNQGMLALDVDCEFDPFLLPRWKSVGSRDQIGRYKRIASRNGE